MSMPVSVSVSVSAPAPASLAVPVSASVLATLTYADLFDYPLSADEICRYQVGTRYYSDQIARALEADPHLVARIESDGQFYCLRGRSHIFPLRRKREAVSARIWKRAAIYTRWAARLPFVRMVAVTGALAMRNISGRPDIDLLVVARRGRVWICRRALILQVRVARLFGDDLCPNYVLSDSKLCLDQRDLFTAHELVQMVPAYGLPLYRRMLDLNRWAAAYLPCAFPPTAPATDARGRAPQPPLSAPRLAIERALSARLLDGWERWEQRRLQAKLRPVLGHAAEVVCSPDQCKGHTGLHRRSVLVRYAQRMREHGLYDDFAPLFAPDDAPY